jgi:hypothetical protein
MNQLKRVNERLPWEIGGGTSVPLLDSLWTQVRNAVGRDLFQELWTKDSTFIFLDYEPFEGIQYLHLKIHS